jgi:hypothetical protein
MRHEVARHESPNQREIVQWDGAAALSGGEQLLARDAEVVAWLTKVHGEKANESRPWSEFLDRPLARFLTAIGIDLEKAKKAHADALGTIPVRLRSLETGIPALRGASFLKSTPEVTALSLKRRYQTQARA